MRKKSKIKVYLDEFESSENAGLYSIWLDDNQLCETDLFLELIEQVKEQEKNLAKLSLILDKLTEKGVLERFLRPESRITDRVWAIPILKNNNLRLYLIRINDNLAILGGGGVKDTDTYQEDKHLKKCVDILAAIDQRLRMLEKTSKINYYQNSILGLGDDPLTIYI